MGAVVIRVRLSADRGSLGSVGPGIATQVDVRPVGTGIVRTQTYLDSGDWSSPSTSSRRPCRSTVRRPLIVIPARFSEHATALRYEAEVTARALVRAVYVAGGEPVVIHPSAPGAEVDVAAARERLWFVDGILLPGGGDVAARWSNEQPHPSEYGVDEEQDAFDLAVARVALADQIPLLAICRGNQIVNVALGGDLVQDMTDTTGTHLHRVHELRWSRTHRWATSSAPARRSPATTTSASRCWARAWCRRRTPRTV